MNDSVVLNYIINKAGITDSIMNDFQTVTENQQMIYDKINSLQINQTHISPSFWYFILFVAIILGVIFFLNNLSSTRLLRKIRFNEKNLDLYLHQIEVLNKTLKDIQENEQLKNYLMHYRSDYKKINNELEGIIEKVKSNDIKEVVTNLSSSTLPIKQFSENTNTILEELKNLDNKIQHFQEYMRLSEYNIAHFEKLIIAVQEIEPKNLKSIVSSLNEIKKLLDSMKE